MNNSNFLKVWMLAIILIVGFVLIFTEIGYSQFFPSPLPICLAYYYMGFDCYNNLFYSDYGYFNSINGFLLGYIPFTPFLNQNVYGAYNLAGIHTYPYFGFPYQTTFPYSTLAGIPIPYARFDYPTYTYGVPDFYLSWVLMQ